MKFCLASRKELHERRRLKYSLGLVISFLHNSKKKRRRNAPKIMDLHSAQTLGPHMQISVFLLWTFTNLVKNQNRTGTGNTVISSK